MKILKLRTFISVRNLWKTIRMIIKSQLANSKTVTILSKKWDFYHK